jgi:hypothetical protein
LGYNEIIGNNSLTSTEPAHVPGSKLIKRYGDPPAILFGRGGDKQESVLAEQRAVGAVSLS